MAGFNGFSSKQAVILCARRGGRKSAGRLRLRDSSSSATATATDTSRQRLKVSEGPSWLSLSHKFLPRLKAGLDCGQHIRLLPGKVVLFTDISGKVEQAETSSSN